MLRYIMVPDRHIDINANIWQQIVMNFVKTNDQLVVSIKLNFANNFNTHEFK